VAYTSADESSAPHFNLASLQRSVSHITDTTIPQPALVVFSGGTAFNSVAAHVRSLTTKVTHVLPVSDDGGSTAEIVRVLGGPAVGDIRSRCLRLADDSDEEAEAVRRLLAYRLPSRNAADAKKEWYDIVEGEHPLWKVGYLVLDCCACVYLIRRWSLGISDRFELGCTALRLCAPPSGLMISCFPAAFYRT